MTGRPCIARTEGTGFVQAGSGSGLPQWSTAQYIRVLCVSCIAAAFCTFQKAISDDRTDVAVHGQPAVNGNIGFVKDLPEKCFCADELNI